MMRCFGIGRCSHPLICKVMGCAVKSVFRVAGGYPPITGDDPLFDVPPPARDHRITCPECNGDGVWEVPGSTPDSWRKSHCNFCGGSGYIEDDEEGR